MTWTLYGHTGSGSAAVEAALLTAGVPFTQVLAATWDDQSALDELRRVNPLQQIPTLVTDDGTVLTESAGILIELGLRFPASGLLPSDPAARARTIRGLVYVAANCYAMIGIIDYPQRALADASEAEAKRVIAGSKARLHTLWLQFADQFAPEPFLGGAQPDALDLLATVVSKWGGARALLKAQRPQWYPVLERVEQHALWREVFERHWPARA